MRVLWVDADGNPWTEASGWQVLEDFGVKVTRVPSVESAKPHLSQSNFDLLVVRAEQNDVAGLLVQARKLFSRDERKLILASSEWSKEQFKVHSKTEGAAHRYARIPMPPEGFLGLVADLFDCSVEELADFEVAQAAPEAPAKSAKKEKKAESEDAEVLRRYLKIKEEQLEISDGEKEELALENERLQNEAQHLQMRLRELEHLHEEVTKKLSQVEEEKQQLELGKKGAETEKERLERALEEKIRMLEAEKSESAEKYENLRVRVRKDIRKIRENERDLEARLELLRKDSETLLQARDNRVLEMQRKIDALEFDLDQVQDGRVQAQMEAERYLAKLSRVARALNIAVGMIEDEPISDDELEELAPSGGGAVNAEAVPAAASPNPATAESAAEPDAVPEPQELSDDLAALAGDGDPTRMIQDVIEGDSESEPNSSSG